MNQSCEEIIKVETLVSAPAICAASVMVGSLFFAVYFHSLVAASFLAVMCLVGAGIMLGAAVRYMNPGQKTFTPQGTSRVHDENSWKLARGQATAPARQSSWSELKQAIRTRKQTATRLLPFFGK